MKDKLNFSSKIANLVVSWFNVFMFLAMRCCWSGISKTLKYEDMETEFSKWIILNLPPILWFVFIGVFITNIVLFLIMDKKKNKWSYILNGVNGVFFIVILVVIMLGAIDYMDYIWPAFFGYLGISVLVLLGVFFIFIYPKTPLHEKKYFKYSALGVILLVLTIHLFNISFNRITCGATVYAVEKEYQIVFSSSIEARAWVTLDGNEEVRYFDDYNGANKTYTKIHKVHIPMDIMDEADNYTIHVQKLTYRGPFGGYFGREITRTYDFRPVDMSDGVLDYYSISDIHMASKASAKTVSYFDNIELLVVAGDIVSMMDSFADANLTNEISHKITNGEYPVIYARGNHEIKGKYAEEFHNFVGTHNGNFYFNVYLDNAFVTVLDIGEDHDDDYWEYYDTAFYEDYRNKQVKMLEDTLNEGKHLNYEYKMAVCHIPVVYVNARKNHTKIKDRLTDLLNKLDINMCISGHQHDLLVFEPGTVTSYEKPYYNKDYRPDKKFGGYLTDFKFVNLGVSKRGYEQFDDSTLTNMKSQIGVYTKVELSKNIQTVQFTNSKGEAVEVLNFFADINYGDTLVFSLETNTIVK